VIVSDGPPPLAVFVYRRPRETGRLLSSLARCPEAGRLTLYVFGDGPAGPEDSAAVLEVRRVVADHRSAFHAVHSEWRDENAGLARSVITGTSRVCDEHGRVVVLEDDLIVSRSFMTFMSAGLSRFADDDRVAAVAGHTFPVPVTPATAFFARAVSSWGWATWKRAWANFEEFPDVTALSNPGVRRDFDLGGMYPYSHMLRRQQRGEIDSWAVRWWWTVFRAKQLTLFPNVTLVRNDGFGHPLATNTRRSRSNGPVGAEWDPDASCPALPPDVRVDPTLEAQWRAALHVPGYRQALARVRDRLQVRR